MLAIMLAQVIWRYFLEMPLTWSEEIARYLFVVVTYLGAAIAIAEKSHIEINITDLIFDKIGIIENKRKLAELLIEIIRSCITCIIAIIFSYYCRIYALDDYRFDQVSTAVGMPLYYVSGFIFVSMVVIVLHSLIQVVVHGRDLTGRFWKKPSEP
jgi:TRAP-type C4-dicarboxylate transport system permease small subunit